MGSSLGLLGSSSGVGILFLDPLLPLLPACKLVSLIALRTEGSTGTVTLSALFSSSLFLLRDRVLGLGFTGSSPDSGANSVSCDDVDTTTAGAVAAAWATLVTSGSDSIDKIEPQFDKVGSLLFSRRSPEDRLSDLHDIMTWVRNGKKDSSL